MIPANCISNFSCRVRFEDSAGRKLYLYASIVPFSDARIKVIL